MRSKLLRIPLVHLVAVMWEHAAGQRRKVVLYTVLAIAAIGVDLCHPLVLALLMNTVQGLGEGQTLADTQLPLGLMLLLGLGFWLLHGPSRVLEMRTAFFTRARFLSVLFKKTTGLPMKWQRDQHSGEIIDQIQRATSALAEFAQQSFEVLHMLTRFLGALVILMLFEPRAALVMLLLSGVIILVIVLFDKVLIAQYDAINKGYNVLAAKVQDFLTNVSTVITLRLEERAGHEVANRIYGMFPLVAKNAVINEFKWATTSALINISRVGILAGYLWFELRSGRTVKVGTFYALYEYLHSMAQAFFEFTWQYGTLVRRSRQLANVAHIEQAYHELVEPQQNACLPANWQCVQLRDVWFSHHEDAQSSSHVCGVSLELIRGRMTALIGESGSGKSTLMSLIRGTLDTSAVEVLCDGRIMPHKLAHVGRHCTLIPQDPEIFAGTIRFNVTLGIEACDAEILWAIELARFYSVLERLPDGLETDIAEKGINLSGGEKQRLALARGLFFARESGSDIILMDEPTSSVDQLNEWQIYQGVKHQFKDCCVVSSLHKLSLLPLFDQVLVFKQGQIVEQGFAADLLERNGELARLWCAAAKSDQDEAEQIAAASNC